MDINNRNSRFTAHGHFTRPPDSRDTAEKTPNMKEQKNMADIVKDYDMIIDGEYSVAPGENEGMGTLPPSAPLANPYVPFQRNNAAQYLPSKGVVRGTLFPGLDLPFKAMVNEGEMWGTPLAELMALDFAIKELQLYLDTHSDDTEALKLLANYSALQKEGTDKYVELYGPISVTQVNAAKGYTWIKDPWPWEYSKEDK